MTSLDVMKCLWLASTHHLEYTVRSTTMLKCLIKVSKEIFEQQDCYL